MKINFINCFQNRFPRKWFSNKKISACLEGFFAIKGSVVGCYHDDVGGRMLFLEPADIIHPHPVREMIIKENSRRIIFFKVCFSFCNSGNIPGLDVPEPKDAFKEVTDVHLIVNYENGGHFNFISLERKVGICYRRVTYHNNL
jgi:hypothetical protein